MTSRKTVVSLLLAFTVTLGVPPAAGAAPTLKGRAVWAHPRDAGTTEASVRAFVTQLASAHVNTVVMEVKTATGVTPASVSPMRSSPATATSTSPPS